MKMKPIGIRAAFQRLSPWVRSSVGLVLVMVVFALDCLMPRDMGFSIFYLIPIVLVASTVGWGGAAFTSILSGLLWVLADHIRGAHHYSEAWIPIWNMVMRVMIFLLVARLLIRMIAERERAGRAEAAAQAATRAKSDFLANMSHEIRTPLNAMLGAAQLLDESELEVRQREFLRIFRTEGEQLRRLINDVLDLSKVEAGRFRLEIRPFHLGQMAQAIVQTYSLAARDKDLRLEAVTAPAADRAWCGDGHRLRQVLANLLSNAIKFTQSGGIVLRIAAEPAHDDMWVLKFSVEDTGVGIDAAGLARLFQRYEQLGNTADDRPVGTGLGLSISRALVEAMGGDLQLDSQPGRGSNFYFTIRLAAATVPEMPAAPFDRTSQVKALDGKTVLLVEDYKVNQLIFAEYLKAAGCRVTLAANGREGVKLFSSGAFDAVIMDMQMPVLDGWNATREIRAWERRQCRRTTPVVALTASALDEDRVRCREAGCTHFLAKPLTKHELLRALAEVVASDGESAPLAGPEANPDPLQAMFRDDTRMVLTHIRRALAARDWPQVERGGHQLAGLGATFGFPSITTLGRAFEAGAADRNEARIREAAAALEAILADLPTP